MTKVVINPIGTTPTVVHEIETSSSSPEQITVSKPRMFDVVNIYQTFDSRFVSNSQHNLVPILVLGMNDSVPSGTAPGTAILRRVNTNLEGNNA